MPPRKDGGEAKGRKAKERQAAGEGGKVRDRDITMWTETDFIGWYTIYLEN